VTQQSPRSLPTRLHVRDVRVEGTIDVMLWAPKELDYPILIERQPLPRPPTWRERCDAWDHGTIAIHRYRMKAINDLKWLIIWVSYVTICLTGVFNTAGAGALISMIPILCGTYMAYARWRSACANRSEAGKERQLRLTVFGDWSVYEWTIP
jgi:hypothetical protein